MQRQTNYCMQAFFQKLEMNINWFLTMQLAGTFSILLHEEKLENAHYCKGNMIFPCRHICLKCSCNLQEFSRSNLQERLALFFIKYSWNSKLLQSKSNVCMQTIFRRICICNCKIIKLE